ncbi:type IX secretion system membrane protein PorP/SprF [Tenacibaculum finnmarkense]|uniref:PorP/SprF family type IX secretion system membrane protein n=1 Tax=Tenacibaculum finnmarkense TaxID=2781243 RepID=UPI00187B2D67|nr:type IX secretion system membrane protein PorP/SprF [Tenacibaculum finnmarkense]MBE7646268.1 type IX secretion system membrane protein PorP/SprF [Tenacibaculum finnmarkense genomovar ulcerans]MBE7648292.1 type IX secretion system membrane protein PorP/SprF [Tenacibaculum finnmarkense genomovar ulcerans]MBE7688421.1 type IX secretion system membrane protein PorP/SprF [Tenacibaculum finnmarkense genomovar ulcerans]MCD8423312.1 type IX secretion system membrane protein PorP/SprF [Tenacibaculum 
MKILLKKRILVLVLFLLSLNIYSQQDPQYTQYMYNTMSVNPAYSGTKGHAVITALGRTQWIGLKGAPNTQTLSYDTPVGYSGLGLGLNFVNDKIGPVNETYLDVNAAYSIILNKYANLSFGLKLGGRFFNVDWSRGKYKEPDRLFKSNINKFLPTIGAGIYYYTDKWYTGLSVPNLLRADYYNSSIESVATERLHYFLIAGYIFDLSDTVKFKPAFLSKIVSGAPFSLDVSANFLFNNLFNAGLSWRLNDSVNAIMGFQVNEKLNIGYSYDLTTSNLQNYNSGTHELVLRYEMVGRGNVLSPRFF